MLILLISLLILLFVEYSFSNKDVLSPSLITTFMFFMSTFMLVFYADRWGITWTDKTTAIILVGIAGAIVGELLAKRVIHSSNDLFTKSIRIGGRRFLGRDEFSENPIVLKLSALLGLNIICVGTLIIYYQETVHLASLYSGIESLMIARVNEIKASGYGVSSLAQQLLTLSNSIALILSYIVLYNQGITKKIRYRLLYITPIALYLLTAVLTSSRAILLHFLVAIFMIWLLIRDRRRGFKRNGNMKLFSRVLVLVIAIVTLFYYAGLLTGKSLHYEALSDNLANYFCSSIYGLNSYMRDPSRFRSNDFFGIHTFSGLYTTLRSLGITIPPSIIAYEYIPCGYVVTNIYTAFRRYYQDFGWIGLFAIMFIISFFYSKLIAKNRTEKYSGMRTIISGMILYPLVFMSIEERFFMNVVSISTIYSLVYIFLLYGLLIYPQTKLKSHERVTNENTGGNRAVQSGY